MRSDVDTAADHGFFACSGYKPATRALVAWPGPHCELGEAALQAQVGQAALARKLHDGGAAVSMLVQPGVESEAKMAVGADIVLIPLDIADLRIASFGPSFLTDGEGGLAGMAWSFNGWGGRDRAIAHQDGFALKLLKALDLEAFEGELILEHGAIDFDGRGQLLADRNRLFDPDRNPVFDPAQIEERLALDLGALHINWFDGDAEGTPPPTLARFVAARHVLAVQDLLIEGNLTVTELTAQAPSGQSYLDFIVLPDAVLVPQFGIEDDHAALDQIGGLFDGKEAQGIDLPEGTPPLTSLVITLPG